MEIYAKSRVPEQGYIRPIPRVTLSTPFIVPDRPEKGCALAPTLSAPAPLSRRPCCLLPGLLLTEPPLNFKLCNDRATAAETARGEREGAERGGPEFRAGSTRYIQMGILPGLFLFKQPSYLVTPPPPDHRRFIIKATRRATSEDCGKDSHGVSRFRLALHRGCFAYQTDPRGRGGPDGGRGWDRCVCIFERSVVVQRVRSVDVSHGKPLTRLQRTFSDHRLDRTLIPPILRCISLVRTRSSPLTDFQRHSARR